MSVKKLKLLQNILKYFIVISLLAGIAAGIAIGIITGDPSGIVFIATIASCIGFAFVTFIIHYVIGNVITKKEDEENKKEAK